MAGSDARVMAESFTVAADGSYAARLIARPGSALWYPERWTLGGPEPYAVPLPVEQPEETDSSVLPLADGRVLIARRAGPRYAFALLYPSGPDTGELRLGTVEAETLSLLPPAPCGRRAYALVPDEDERSTSVWLVAGAPGGTPERVAHVQGRCTGGAWLDREGRLLAVDRTAGHGATGHGAAAGREGLDRAAADRGAFFDRAATDRGAFDRAATDRGGWPGGGATKTVVVDLGRGGEVSPLLQIAEESNDRLLLADPYSGLLLVRSDAPGEDRLGWGVLGSHRPVRFPEVLRPSSTRLTPFAVQPGQLLTPERCGVALRVDAAAGTWLAVWRPGMRELRHIASPPGWLTGKGLWSPEGELCVPYSTAHLPCGVARLRAPLPDPEPPEQPARPVPGQAGPPPEQSGTARLVPGQAAPEGAPEGAPAQGAAEHRAPAPRAPEPRAPESRPPEARPSQPGPPEPWTDGPPAQEPPAPQAPRVPPDPGPGPFGTPQGDVTGLQHHGHGGPSSGLLDSGGFGPVSAGGTGSFGALAEPGSKPVPLQQAPLATGMR